MTNPETADAAARRLAADPARSFLVEAPAGSGKTRLLVARYLALLKTVAHPEEILAITFTTKAAAEMRARVLQALHDDPAIRAIDEHRGWDLHRRPERLKIQTIDSFALGLARRLPVASALSADNIAEHGATLYEEAAWRLLERVAGRGEDARLIADFVALLDNDAEQARAFIAEALGKRDQWVAAVTAVANSREQVAASVAAGVARLRQAVTERVAAAVAPALRDDLETLGAFTAQQLKQSWPGLDVPEGWRHLADALLRKDGVPRKTFNVGVGFPPRFHDEKRLASDAAKALGELGLAAALHTEAAFRQEAALALVLVPVALWLPATPVETALLIASVLAVLVVELLNTAIEATLDRHSREYHVLTAKAKDLGSAAVLLSLVLCASVWTLVLLAVHERGLL